MSVPSRHMVMAGLNGDIGGGLVTEAHHRIANNLTTIAGLVRSQIRDIIKQDRTFTASEVVSIMEDVGRRIESVGLFHRLLADTQYDDLIDLNVYLMKIAQLAIDSMSMPGEITVNSTAPEPLRIPADHALPVGFLVSELVTNSVKYAHPAHEKGAVGIGCRRLEREIEIVVTDDGVGFPDGFDPERAESLGLRLVRMMAKQLRGAVKFESSPLGVTATLLAPAGSLPSQRHNQ
jgi:two-component sensor histidine kinase